VKFLERWILQDVINSLFYLFGAIVKNSLFIPTSNACHPLR
jgi:hypothetical protein